MGRLTKYRGDRADIEKIKSFEVCAEVCKYYDCYDCPIQEAITKLAHYEDMEEQGRLIEQKHGRWVVEAYPVDSDDMVIIPYIEHQHSEPFCSLCHAYANLDGGGDYVTSNYCPNCGAEMELKELEGVKE